MTNLDDLRNTPCTMLSYPVIIPVGLYGIMQHKFRWPAFLAISVNISADTRLGLAVVWHQILEVCQ